ncbi:MAG: acetolactate synthase large subunit [Geminicoccaceae bacterium]
MLTAADTLIATAQAGGLDICFANPGTTEMPLVVALERARGVRAVLGLHENVCTGAADGYARVAGKPAATLLHLGPGYANGLANLHNARRARSAIVNLIGEHASWHIAADAPLTMDIEAVAGSVSALVRRVGSPEDSGPAMAESWQAATARRGAIASLICPHDHQTAPGGPPAAVAPGLPLDAWDATGLAAAVEALRSGEPAVLFLGGTALYGDGLAAASRIARRSGCALLAELGFAKMESGSGLPPVLRLPYFPEVAAAALARYRHVILVGAKPPVSFFGYPDKPARYLEGREGVIQLVGQDGDAAAALAALAAELGARELWAQPAEPLGLPPDGPLDAAAICGVLAALQPRDAIVIPTAVTSAQPYAPLACRSAPHLQLVLTGGAIGEGPALAAGAALAAPGRKVINLEADGSAAYLPQALWTQAREGLDVVTIICSNGRYRILRLELERAGIAAGPVATALTGLDNPRLDWLAIAGGFGVPASRAATVDELARALGRALAEPGPALIEAML